MGRNNGHGERFQKNHPANTGILDLDLCCTSRPICDILSWYPSTLIQSPKTESNTEEPLGGLAKSWAGWPLNLFPVNYMDTSWRLSPRLRP